jgi:hypothetical protein
VVVVIDVPHPRAIFHVAPLLDERGRRLVATAEAFAAGCGGIAAVIRGSVRPLAPLGAQRKQKVSVRDTAAAVRSAD